VEEETIVGVLVDWAVGTMKTEVNAVDRALKYDIVRMGIEGFEMFEEGAKP
jgi:hypothetical protein